MQARLFDRCGAFGTSHVWSKAGLGEKGARGITIAGTGLAWGPAK